jgi:hypothetical protein
MYVSRRYDSVASNLYNGRQSGSMPIDYFNVFACDTNIGDLMDANELLRWSLGMAVRMVTHVHLNHKTLFQNFGAHLVSHVHSKWCPQASYN